MSQRIGTAVLALLAIGLGIATFVASWPVWVIAPLALIAVTSAAFTLMPEKRKAAEPTSPKIPLNTPARDSLTPAPVIGPLIVAYDQAIAYGNEANVHINYNKPGPRKQSEGGSTDE